MQDEATTDLVLVGGGHAHVQIVRRWMMDPVAGVRLTLVVDRPIAVYSGMVPGFVAGDYAMSELEIDVVPLARRAGARVVLAAATGVDPVARRIALEGRPSLAYDVASLDVGSTVRGLDLPGVREHALSTRPIGRFVTELDHALATFVPGSAPRLSIVGAGAAGCELAFTLGARLRGRGLSPEITLIDAGDRVMLGASPRVAARVQRELERRGVLLRLGSRVVRVEKGAVRLEGEVVATDLVVWATGAAPVETPSHAGLPVDGAGFVRVDRTLQVEGCDGLYAVGDCASLAWAPWVGKAGVYAVREGPVLDANLRAQLQGGPRRLYPPQRDFLALLNLGDGEALGAKWGRTATGRSVWALKDWIDRRFMRRFQVLDAAGAPSSTFPTPEAMGMEEMACGGCAAKLGQTALSRALARLPSAPPDGSVLLGLERPDDVAALRLPRGDVLLATIDAFRAFTDDPWLVGRVAAVNAVSDVLAKGGVPRHALALVTVPDPDAARAEETLFQVLSGVRAGLDPLGVTLVGGHTTQGAELFVGLSITGAAHDAEAVLRLDGARPGDVLLLTKPLGTGVVLAADMQGRVAGSFVAEAHQMMLRDNAHASRIARECGARACTDVSGFGLAGHLAELLRASGVSACIGLDAIPRLGSAAALVASGVRSTFHAQNALGRHGLAIAPELAGVPALELVFDPQTSGGLLIAIAPDHAEAALRRLHEAGDVAAAAIGCVTELRDDGAAFGIAASA